MAIHPIEYRYGTAEMKYVWSQENRLAKILQTEAALARAEADMGLIPAEAAEIIFESIASVKAERVDEIESEIHHDMMAVVVAISEMCRDDAGKWVHFGATSNDILDTATALQIKDAIDILEDKLKTLLKVLVNQAEAHKNTVCCGRTHGQIGVPTTYGLRFAIWASEISRHLDRLYELTPRATVGQMTGAVGTQAAFGKSGILIQKLTMQHLGIGAVDVSNQIIQRDRHAEFVMWMANVVTTLDKIGIEIRTLQRSEIAEIEESFGKKIEMVKNIERIRVIPSNLKDPYSYRKASTGFIFAAFLAGYNPAPTPTRTEIRIPISINLKGKTGGSLSASSRI